ncbi:MAG: triose-phosphate isomerase [Sphingomonas bacterium]|nr:triose-phosphate isomerase [Sphingomonas bacterium]
MRRKLVAGNWKMNGLSTDLAELDAIAAAAKVTQCDVAIAVPATLILLAAKRVVDSPVMIGAQDVHSAEKGAHTGCLSAAMLNDVNASFTLVGHSERRADQGETSADVKAKAEAARDLLSVILCIGETLAERDAGRAEEIVTTQLEASLPKGAAANWLSVAYEPVWAIGTGRTPTVADVTAMHGAIRAKLRGLIGGEADAVRLLYGGSVTAENAAALLSAGDVDGALVGGASLTAAKFVPIIEAAAAA